MTTSLEFVVKPRVFRPFIKKFARINPILLNNDEIKIVRVSYELSVVIVYRTRVDVMKLTSLLE
jgi:hypothetical protein